MLDIFVSQVCLESPGIVTAVRQREAARMSKHVGMRLKSQLGLIARALDHAGEAGGCERCSTL
jgi:hypothetical protein